MKHSAINPATEEIIGEWEIADKKAVIGAVKQARMAFGRWSETDISDRIKILEKASWELKSRKNEIATLITKEMGKPISESEGEVEATLGDMDWFLNSGKKALEDEHIDFNGKKGRIAFAPLGVVAAITPWNFPLNNPFYKIIPTLISGNTIVWKPSELASLIAVKIFDVFKAVLPDGVLNLTLGDETTGKALVSSKVDIISLTGSTATGRDVMKRASKGLKKVVLELGGNDPFVVLDDADLDAAVKGAVRGRFYNCGQVCSADKRFYVEKDVYDEFVRRFKEGTEALKVGNPLDRSTEIGPLVSKEQLETLERQVNDSVRMGAKALIGGRRGATRGYFYQPTLLTDVTNSMRAVREETFGPVAPVISVKDVKQAIKMANDSPYGLAASVWTKDENKAREISRQLNVGTVWLNKSGEFRAEMPWGGIKDSGVGREFSRYGFLELVNIKSIF